MDAKSISQELNESKWQKIGEWERQKAPYFKKEAGIEAKIALEWMKNKKSSKKLLDIGCGAGRNSILFSKNGFECLGIDFSKTAIKLAKILAKEEKSKAKFKCIDFFDLNLPSKEKFDLAMDFGCFHHLKKSQWKEYKKKLLGILNPNAHFLLYCFSKESKETGNYKKGKDYSLRKGAYNRYFSINGAKEAFSPEFKAIKAKTIKEKGRLLAFNIILFSLKPPI